MANLCMQLCMRSKRLQQLFFLVVVFKPVIVQQVVEAEAMSGSYRAINRNVCLQRTRGADANDIERMNNGPDLARFEVNVYQCIKFIEHDINIIRTNAGRNNRYSFVANEACMRNKLP